MLADEVSVDGDSSQVRMSCGVCGKVRHVFGLSLALTPGQREALRRKDFSRDEYQWDDE